MDYKELCNVLGDGGYSLQDFSTHGSPDLHVVRGEFQICIGESLYSPSLAACSNGSYSLRIHLNEKESILQEQVQLGRFLAENGVFFEYSGSLVRQDAERKIKEQEGIIERITSAEEDLEQSIDCAGAQQLLKLLLS